MVQEKPFVSVAMTGPPFAGAHYEVMSMFHSDTQALIDLWFRMARDRDGRARVPERRDLRPERLGARLARTFLVDRRGQMRLVGGWIEGLHDLPLADGDWFGVWQAQSRPGIELALMTVAREVRPLVLTASLAVQQPLLEIGLTPLRDETGRIDLVLGLYAPTGTLTLTADADRTLSLSAALPVGDPARASLSLASLDGRRIA